MGALIAIVRQWRKRWRPEPIERREIDMACANVFSSLEGEKVIDYLLETYFIAPLDGGAEGPTAIKLAEANGGRLVIRDILERIDRGRQPEGEISDESEYVDPRL